MFVCCDIHTQSSLEKVRQSILDAQAHFAITLQIFSEYSLEVNVRFLAVLYFKNGVDRYWRKTAPNAISEEEKVICLVLVLVDKQG